MKPSAAASACSPRPLVWARAHVNSGGHASISSRAPERPAPQAAAPPPPPPLAAVPGRQHARRRGTPAAAFPLNTPVPVVVEGNVLIEATGVPLVDELLKMKTAEMAAQHGLRLVAAAFVGVVIGTLVLRWIDSATSGRLGVSTDFNFFTAALASTLRPAQVLLPYWGVSYGMTVVSAVAQVAAVKLKSQFAALCRGQSGEVLEMLKWFTQLVQDTSELVVIIFVAWSVINFKNSLVGAFAASLRSDAGVADEGVVQLLRPLSGVLTFFTLLAAAATALGAYGVNIAPLMASVGGLSVVAALATQGLAANLVSALALFTGRPFEVGDRIQLLNGGLLVVEGTVVAIEPMRTIIRDSNGNPSYINNAQVTNYIVTNLTQGRSYRATHTGEPLSEVVR